MLGGRQFEELFDLRPQIRGAEGALQLCHQLRQGRAAVAAQQDLAGAAIEL
jgi:hypothetical protein